MEITLFHIASSAFSIWIMVKIVIHTTGKLFYIYVHIYLIHIARVILFMGIIYLYLHNIAVQKKVQRLKYNNFEERLQ